MVNTLSMDVFQILALILFIVFYVAYFGKMVLMNRRGIAANLLCQGDKPKKALITEMFLRVVTPLGIIVQFVSILFPASLWPLPAPAAVRAAGLVLMALAIAFFVPAIVAMRDNWRAGFNRGQGTHLVTGGIYRVSRNPAFVGFDLLYIGCAAATPNPVIIVVTAAAGALFHFQILGEEQYCTEAFGESYILYKKKTMRYIGKRK
ncbi:MAG: isoprenylcysteine carboxylmethyltransferase family protein [Oscillospiraceae bacterium]|nr:isoprenylcysteine carboxylmethyltransferase family protein [Oscillospiraceae bacterium]